jgi:hypothetical protein
MIFYSLGYVVQHVKYNLTVYTNLMSLDSETYNSSFTVMNYARLGTGLWVHRTMRVSWGMSLSNIACALIHLILE